MGDMLSSRNKLWKIESFRSINHWRDEQVFKETKKKKTTKGAFGNQSKFNKNKTNERSNKIN